MVARVKLIVGLGLAGVALALTGCGPTTKDKLVGSWEGKITVDQEVIEQKLNASAKNPVTAKLAKMMMDQALKRLDAAKITMEFGEDGSFRGTTSVVPGQVRETLGTWKILKTSERQVEIELQLDDKEEPEQSTLVFFNDDEFLLQDFTETQNLPEGVQLIFKRVKQPAN